MGFELCLGEFLKSTFLECPEGLAGICHAETSILARENKTCKDRVRKEQGLLGIQRAGVSSRV